MARPAQPLPRVGLPAWLQTLLVQVSVERYPRWVMRRHPQVVAMRFLGLGDVVGVRDPEALQELFAAPADEVRAGEANAVALGSVLGSRSVLCLDGDEHLAMRRRLLPPLHGDALQGHVAVMEQVAREHVARWPTDRPIALLPRLRAVAVDVVLHAVLGTRDPARLDALRRVVPRVVEVPPFAVVLGGAVPGLDAHRLGRRLPWIAARRRLDALLQEEIDAHRAGADGGRGDVLGLLLASRDDDGAPLADDDVRDQLVTLLVAGNETTAASMAWAVERLVRHPRALAALVADLDAGGTAHLDAVVAETLRVRPVLDVAWRRLAASREVGGCPVAAGTLVTPSIRGVQREAHLDDPHRFRPERFLTGARPPAATQIPFGGGTRRCVGAAFATAEMRTVLRVLLERRTPELPPGALRRGERQSRLRSIGTVPARGARVVLRGRD